MLVGATAGLLLVYTTDLPQVEALEAYRPSSITELYDDHERVIGSFALQRRVVASYDDFPPVLRDALVSIEDKDFYRHSGINFWRIVGAAYRDIESGGKVQGASTLTMQLARNLFLSPDRSFHRKVQEAMLAIQIERRFTKPQIFTLYANQIFLGHGVYGFEAASEFYFSKPAKQLTLEEAALLAGLPKGPTVYSPINHPDRAQKRRNLVINAMLEDGKITAAQAADARSAPLVLRLAHDPNSLAPYFVEEIRRYLEEQVRSRPGSRGRLEGLHLARCGSAEGRESGGARRPGRLRTAAWLEGPSGKRRGRGSGSRQIFASRLGRRAGSEWIHPRAGHLIGYGNRHAEVRPIHRRSRPGRRRPGRSRSLPTFSKPATSATSRFFRSARTARRASAWSRIPGRRARCSPSTTPPAESRPWSAAAISTIRNSTAPPRPCGRSGRRSSPTSTPRSSTRAPVPTTPSSTSPSALKLPSGPYSPHNYDEKFEGIITLRRALAQSRNIPALKLANKVGIKTVIDYAGRFGITAKLPPYLPVALGVGGDYADRADLGLQRVSQRRRARDSALHHPGHRL